MTEVGHVTRLTHEGKELLIVGTAHVSPKSVEEVERVIAEEQPDTVCVELDENRHRALFDRSVWQELDIFQVIRQKRVLFLMSNLSLSAFQKRMGDKFGVKPGAELRAAVEAADKAGAELVLADRDIQATLKRTWGNLGFFEKMKMISALLLAPFQVQEMEEEDLESLKDTDTIGEAIHGLAEQFPGVRRPLIQERDHYLISKVQEAPGQKIVAVVGAAHVAGMVAHLGVSADYEELSKIPPPGKLARALKWVIPVLVLSAFAYGWYTKGDAALENMLYAWVLPNMIGAGLLTLLARGHVLTILAAAISSPVTSLNPALPCGAVAGLVEAYLRKPTVEDCEGAISSATSIKGVFQNRFTHVLVIFLAANLGSSFGAWAAGIFLVKLLAG